MASRWNIAARTAASPVDRVRLIDFSNPDANDWLAVNQFTVIEGQNNRRPDIVVFVNGLPLGIIELKIPEDTDKWFAAAYKQIQTYKQEIPSLMHYNEVTVISDGLEARIGSLTANQEWFKVWRTIEGSSMRRRRHLNWRRSFAACSRSAASSI